MRQRENDLRIEDLFKDLQVQLPSHIKALIVTGLTTNSKEVRPGDIFVAIKGSQRDGHDYIQEATSLGAVAIVCNKDFPNEGKNLIKVEDTSKILPHLAKNLYQNPLKGMTVIGITGTNGKTTTSFLIESILKTNGFKVALIGTLGFRHDGVMKYTDLTTPDPLTLMKIFDEIRKKGITHVVMEVSSHSLAQRRVDAIRFDIAIFTNLSRDHLDYHKDMEEYFLSKRRVFELLRTPSPHKQAIINLDDPWGKRLLDMIPSGIVGYGIDPSKDIYPISYELKQSGIKSRIMTPVGEISCKSKLIGLHNLYNIMAATGCAYTLGITQEIIEKGIAKVQSVPGRLEPVSNDLGIHIFVDYAHTPDALEKVLSNIKTLTSSRITLVFGCGGDRDRGKRPLMGKVGVQLADWVIITSDNPRTEDPISIVQEIEQGIKDLEAVKNPNYTVEIDRRRAIELALRNAKPGDVIIIAGKGHEDYQIIGNEKIHFSDKEVVIEVLDSLRKEGK